MTGHYVWNGSAVRTAASFSAVLLLFSTASCSRADESGSGSDQASIQNGKAVADAAGKRDAAGVEVSLRADGSGATEVREAEPGESAPDAAADPGESASEAGTRSDGAARPLPQEDASRPDLTCGLPEEALACGEDGVDASASVPADSGRLVYKPAVLPGVGSYPDSEGCGTRGTLNPGGGPDLCRWALASELILVGEIVAVEAITYPVYIPRYNPEAPLLDACPWDWPGVRPSASFKITLRPLRTLRGSVDGAATVDVYASEYYIDLQWDGVGGGPGSDGGVRLMGDDPSNPPLAVGATLGVSVVRDTSGKYLILGEQLPFTVDEMGYGITANAREGVCIRPGALVPPELRRYTLDEIQTMLDACEGRSTVAERSTAASPPEAPPSWASRCHINRPTAYCTQDADCKNVAADVFALVGPGARCDTDYLPALCRSWCEKASDCPTGDLLCRAPGFDGCRAPQCATDSDCNTGVCRSRFCEPECEFSGAPCPGQSSKVCNSATWRCVAIPDSGVGAGSSDAAPTSPPRVAVSTDAARPIHVDAAAMPPTVVGDR